LVPFGSSGSTILGDGGTESFSGNFTAKFMASVCWRKLSEVKDAVRELVLLVGAVRDELRGGIGGRSTPRPRLSTLLCDEAAGRESDMVRFLGRGTGSLALLRETLVLRRLDVWDRVME
jgi:hypothetical protein